MATTVEAFKEKLLRQLAALDQMDFPPQTVKVWHLQEDVRAALGDALIRYQHHTWSWGHCRSETCAHNSHDPYTQGDAVFFNARQLEEDEKGNTLYILPSGLLLQYHFAHDNGYHFAPSARLLIKKETA
mgnify:CR=1 FL=1